MDTKDLMGLMEAYSEVYAPQEVDEAVKGADPEMRKAASAERRGGDKRLSPSKAKGYAAHAMQQAAYVDKKTKGKHIPGYAYAEEVENVDEGMHKDAKTGEVVNKAVPGKTYYPAQPLKKTSVAIEKGKKLNKEELDIFDVVLEFLQAEGFAETLEEAQEIMANELDADDIEAIVEATYSAKAARAGKDIGKPGKAFAKIAASAGKRYGSKERGEKVAGAVLAKLRKQHEEVEIGEALTGERYKKVMNKPGGTAYSRKVSADPAKRATRGGRGGESDFGAGDRGSGNKAARRAGKSVDDSRYEY